MKKIKYIIITILLIPIGLGGYIVNNYYEYEAKQEKVREFKRLAFKGYSLVNARKNKEAIAVYEKAIALYDKDSKSLSDLATLYRKNGQLQKAAQYYEKAFESSTENYKYLYNSAIMDYINKNYQRSIEKLYELIHKHRNSLKYYKFLALNYYALDQKENAFGYYAVLEKRENYKKDRVLSELRKEYELLKKKPKPLRIVFQYLQTDDIPKLEELMDKYLAGGYDIKALRTAQKILDKEPRHNLANKTAAKLYYTHEELGEAYRYATNISDHDASSLEMLGGVYQNAGQYENALASYEKSYAKKPTKELLRAMIVCAMKAKKLEEMDTYIERLTKIDPLLSTQLIYAIETKSGIQHSFLDKIVYLSQVEFYKGYCKLLGCKDA